MKKKLTKEELAEIEARKEKSAETFRKNEKERGPGSITNVDVASILGMPEEMITDLFGDEEGKSEDYMTGEGEPEGDHL